MKILASILVLTFSVLSAIGQSCSVTINSNQNWSTANWSCSGGASAPTTPGGVFTGTLNVTINNNDIFTMDMDLTVNGSLNVTTNGNADFTVAAGNTLDVNGDFDASDENNISIVVDGKLQVSGTMEVKNGNSFEGSGIVSGGSLVVKNNNSCGAGGCPTIAFASCTDGNNNFCSNNNTSGPLAIGLEGLSVINDSKPYQLTWQMSSSMPVVEHILQGSTNGYEWEEVESFPNELSIVGVSQVFDYTLVESSFNYYRVFVKNSGDEVSVSNVLYLGANGNTSKSKTLAIAKNNGELLIQNRTTKQGQLVVTTIAGQQLLNKPLAVGEEVQLSGSAISQTILVVFIPNGVDAEVQKLMIR